MPITITVPFRTLLVLCGPAGSGKSTFAAQRFIPTSIVSSDFCRALVCDDVTNQGVNRDTFDLFYYIINKRLFQQRFTVADSTALYADARRKLLDLASRHSYSTCLLIFNIPETTCYARNQTRERRVEDAVMPYHARLLQQTLRDAPNEGWHQLYVLDEGNMDAVIHVDRRVTLLYIAHIATIFPSCALSRPPVIPYWWVRSLLRQHNQHNNLSINKERENINMQSSNSSNQSTVWQRPDVRFPEPFDTIFFDVDGVLIRTTDSFRATDIAVAEYVTGTLNGLDWGQREGRPLITLEDVNAFKQAGGYNNDWDMCYLLASLSTARLREWRGTPFASRSSYEWAALSRAANKEGHGGVEWVNDTIPASARLDYNIIGDLYHEYYWGAAEYEKRFGLPPRFLPDFPGYVQHETMLYAPDFPAQLRAAGIRHLGMITGRIGPEVDSALERMEAYSNSRWWDVVIAADEMPKPDPRALYLAIEAVSAGGGLYIGDTADDHDLVLNYNAVKKASDPTILAAMLVHDDEIPVYQQRGADIIVGSVEDVLKCLPDSVNIK